MHIIEDNLGLPSSIVTRTGLAFEPKFKSRIERDEVAVF
jgi:hypothetical protein